MNNLLKYFIQGVVYTLPVAITIYIIYYSIVSIDNLFPLEIPGLGILVVFVFIIFIGYVGSKLLEKQKLKIEGLILKIPLFKDLYTSFKDFISAFLGDKRRFDSPVLVKLHGSNAEMFGFITQKDLTYLKIDENKIAVYIPFSYAITGNLIVVDKKNITPINAKSADVMKFILSGGVTGVKLSDEKIKDTKSKK